MLEEKLLIGAAALASSVAIGAVLFVLPGLYNTINEIHNEVIDSVQVGLPFLLFISNSQN